VNVIGECKSVGTHPVSLMVLEIMLYQDGAIAHKPQVSPPRMSLRALQLLAMEGYSEIKRERSDCINTFSIAVLSVSWQVDVTQLPFVWGLLKSARSCDASPRMHVPMLTSRRMGEGDGGVERVGAV